MKSSLAIVSLAIEPKNKADQSKMGMVLRKFLDEDPSLQIKFDHEISQTIIFGMSESHLETMAARIKNENNLDCNVGLPKVIYREAITKKVTGVVGKYISQNGSRGKYGYVVIDVEPSEVGKGIIYLDKIRGGAIPREFIKPCFEGIEKGSQNGVLAGYPVTDFQVSLIDGKYHDVDSDEMSFQLAAKYALHDAFKAARPIFQEPIMKLEIVVPQEYWDAVIGDLLTRRAQIKETGNRDKLKIALVNVPLAEMLGYSKVLKLLTKGQASSSMEFLYYVATQTRPDGGTSGMTGNISPKVPPHLGGGAERHFEE